MSKLVAPPVHLYPSWARPPANLTSEETKEAHSALLHNGAYELGANSH
jgi:hypothetical protein